MGDGTYSSSDPLPSLSEYTSSSALQSAMGERRLGDDFRVERVVRRDGTEGAGRISTGDESSSTDRGVDLD